MVTRPAASRAANTPCSSLTATRHSSLLPSVSRRQGTLGMAGARCTLREVEGEARERVRNCWLSGWRRRLREKLSTRLGPFWSQARKERGRRGEVSCTVCSHRGTSSSSRGERENSLRVMLAWARE